MRTLALALCLSVWPAAATDLTSVRHVPNFDQVNDHLYRGGQPSPAGLLELRLIGIKRVIDLRQKGEAEKFEAEQLSKLGIQYTNIPFASFSAPTREQVNTVLTMLMDDNSMPTFLHCRRGKDRTGTVIACYRIQHDGWTNDRALAEAKAHGMSPFERGMRSFVLHFTAMSNGVGVASTGSAGR